MAAKFTDFEIAVLKELVKQLEIASDEVAKKNSKAKRLSLSGLFERSKKEANKSGI